MTLSILPSSQPFTLPITMKHLILSLLLFGSIAHSHEPAAPGPKGAGLKVLVYSNTGYYRHPETPKINRWLVLLGHENGFEVDVTEHWKDLRAEEQRWPRRMEPRA
jgi:hypothetical protein